MAVFWKRTIYKNINLVNTIVQTEMGMTWYLPKTTNSQTKMNDLIPKWTYITLFLICSMTLEVMFWHII